MVVPLSLALSINKKQKVTSLIVSITAVVKYLWPLDPQHFLLGYVVYSQVIIYKQPYMRRWKLWGKMPVSYTLPDDIVPHCNGFYVGCDCSVKKRQRTEESAVALSVSRGGVWLSWQGCLGFTWNSYHAFLMSPWSALDGSAPCCPLRDRELSVFRSTKQFQAGGCTPVPSALDSSINLTLEHKCYSLSVLTMEPY